MGWQLCTSGYSSPNSCSGSTLNAGWYNGGTSGGGGTAVDGGPKCVLVDGSGGGSYVDSDSSSQSWSHPSGVLPGGQIEFFPHGT